VLIGAKDPKSLDVIIEALDALRRRLRGEKPGGILSDLEERIRRDIEEQEDQAFIAELRRAGDRLAKDARAYGEHLVEHAKSGMSGARPGVDLPEKPFRHCPAPDRPRQEGEGIPFDRHVDPVTGRMETFDRAGNPMLVNPRHEVAEAIDEAMRESLTRDGGLGEPPRRRGIPWGKVTQ
jgi:hypothetical protein